MEPAARKKPIGLLAVLGLTLLALGITWYSTWFGRRLSDDEIRDVLAAAGAAIERLEAGAADAGAVEAAIKPRKLQHVLEQVRARIEERDPVAAELRASVARLKDHPNAQIRNDAAWTMGFEEAAEYRAALGELLGDPNLAVRRNAACALANYRDRAARPVLLECLEPVGLRAGAAGTLEHEAKVGLPVSVGRAVAAVRKDGGGTHLVVPELPGRVRAVPVPSGSVVTPESVVIELAPDPKSVLNALVALRLVGEKGDVERLRPFIEEADPRMPPEVAREAKATRDALLGR